MRSTDPQISLPLAKPLFRGGCALSKIIHEISSAILSHGSSAIVERLQESIASAPGGSKTTTKTKVEFRMLG